MAKSGSRTNHSVTDDIARSAHEAVDVLAENAGNAEERIRAAGSYAKDNYCAGKERVREKSAEISDSARGYVGHSPITALGIAFAAGLLVSGLTTRR